ncbi:MAG: hypothetical protein HRU22_18945 [Gammaproteobacteria bacterium]|nr:hypothetical protein [Gammaproteobacteria bacterium]
MKWLIVCLGICGLTLIPIKVMSAEQTISISKVESATVFNIRHLSEQDLIRDQRHQWRLFGKSLLSGVLGYQYGKGSAVDVKFVLDSILSHNQQMKSSNLLASAEKIRLLEMVVTLASGVRKTIILPLQKDQVYRSNDKIRLVHFETGVFIDRVL